jgi:hypothetical protein
MSLPSSRNTTYTAGSPINSVDLNDIQDCIVGKKHGAQEINISPLSFVGDGNWTVAGAVFFSDGGYINSTGAGHCAVPIPIEEGQRITSMVFARYGDGAADFTSVQVFRLTKGGVATDITAAPTSVTNPAAAWADTIVDVTDTACADGDVFWIHFAGNAANLRIGSIRVSVDRL